MSLSGTGLAAAPVRTARRVALRRTIPGLVRGPLTAFEEIGRRAGGEIVRLDLGLFRPYLLTRPEHVQHVFRDNAANYLRDGMMWKPLRRLVGNGLASEGTAWRAHRSLLQPQFSARNVAAMTGPMAAGIAEAVEDLRGYAGSGRRLDVSAEMSRIVQRALILTFFGGRIPVPDADRLGTAITTAFTSLGSRMLLPFVPGAVPLPGDARFRRAVRVVDEIVLPLVREAREPTDVEATHVLSVLSAARDSDGDPFTDRDVRDDLVAMFAAGAETTSVALTWLWIALDTYPDVAAKVYAEIDAATPGEGASRLPYTRMVILELLRLYPVGWLIPRTAREPDSIDGVGIPSGATVLLSPLLTQRMDGVWEDPGVFEPERFLPERVERRHRFAYFPFGAGPHQCLGSHFFLVEAQLVAAAIASRYRPVLCTRLPVRGRAAVTMRPRGRVEMVLHTRPQ
jgi:cytochrome P450